MLQEIILSPFRGFCAGVDRAIFAVEECIERFGTVYVNHQIVHNTHVVRDLESKGAVFIEDIAEVPTGSYLIFSAHGVSPQLKEQSRNFKLLPIDATCPLVTKVHIEAQDYFRKGYSLILIGHAGHQETLGTMGYAPMTLVQTVEDVEKLEMHNGKIVYLTQTTLSLDDTKDIVFALKKKFSNIESPKVEDICYATQNRQDSVKELAERCQLILVVGSQNSSNSKRLVETAKRFGIPSYLIEDESEINFDWLENVTTLGLTSGASVPEFLVKNVLNAITSCFGNISVHNLERIDEKIEFALPRELN
ncbi:MAG: 4-hydroxy-3-methylbut-2-enyl diphosphate reductase [Ignavibacteriales bacterium]|nr:4-hydroxy-3-methylbut-2-enyl diphosphate reductase [Ignavibacteriales bacterium]